MKGKTAFVSILILLLFVPFAALAGDFVQSPAPTEFRGIKFGESLESLKEMIPVPGKGYKNTYYRKDEKLNFGQADIVSVAYYFHDDRLFRVGMAFSGEANYFLIKEKLIKDYGPGRQIGARYGWMWPDFSMEINYDTAQHQGGVYYTFEGKSKNG